MLDATGCSLSTTPSETSIEATGEGLFRPMADIPVDVETGRANGQNGLPGFGFEAGPGLPGGFPGQFYPSGSSTNNLQVVDTRLLGKPSMFSGKRLPGGTSPSCFHSTQVR